MTPESKKMTLFLVDDDPFFLGILEGYLHGLGYLKTQTIDKSPECIDRLSEQPDVIFLDYNMENMNGIETLKRIKRVNPNQLVVFISGQNKINVAVDALKFGAFDYIMKDDITEQKLLVLMEKVAKFRELTKSKQGKGVMTKLLKGLRFF